MIDCAREDYCLVGRVDDSVDELKDEGDMTNQDAR